MTLLAPAAIACAQCDAPLTGGKDTFGSLDWPLCNSCKWYDYDLMNSYKDGIGDLSCDQVGQIVRLANKGFKLPNPDEFTPPRERGFLLCPECGGLLYIEIQEWDSLTGFPTRAGCLVNCLNERALRDRNPEGWWGHRYFRSDWDGVCVDAENWVMRECYRRLVALAEGVTP